MDPTSAPATIDKPDENSSIATTAPSLEDHPSHLAKNMGWVVGAIVIRASSPAQILLIKRAAEEKAFANTWEHPGGSIDTTDASVYTAVERELDEETGLKMVRVVAQIPDMIWGQHKQNKQLNYVVEVIDDSEIKLDPQEHSEWMWALPEDLEKLDMTDDKRRVIWNAFSFASEHPRHADARESNHLEEH
ncbi:MAG: hypothetical protein Q9162_002669 [Coniocarpon cinnabarinum]